MWMATPWEIYKGMMMDRLTKFIKDTKRYLTRTKSTEELLKEIDEFTARPVARRADALVGTLIFPLNILRELNDEPGVLRGRLVINGVSFHVEAIEVAIVDDVQEAVTVQGGEFLSDLPYRDGPWDTVEYKGKEYVIHIFPYTR